MSEDILLTDLTDGVFSLTLNRPKANAFNDELIDATKAAFKQAKKDTDVRCVLLKAKGKLFSAGQELAAFSEGDVTFRKHLLRTYNPLILQMRRLEKPVLASVNGAVAGAALGIVLACDLRIASDKARFIVAFGGIGLAPDSAVSLMLPKLIGLGRAAEAAYLNQPISAEQALAWGLVNRLVSAEELEAAALEFANQLARGPVNAMGYTKRDFNKAIIPNLEEMLDYEAHIQEIVGRGPDHQEGLAAFLEKREPDYTKG
ncbi:MAG: 2-(1,2-epoxy-1,2-dihydrophenyl)acetyl-CoA isomerase [Chloroflexi bacterium]|nr:2-(1,2-epoxy-1,2-dihydrophenyl)acetyl-CoA isomerase [Chloroflexota bacterium]